MYFTYNVACISDVSDRNQAGYWQIKTFSYYDNYDNSY